MPYLLSPQTGTPQWVSPSSILNETLNPEWANFPPNVALIEKFTMDTAASKKNPTTAKKTGPVALSLMAGFKLGADPELFVKDDKGNFVCADFIPGTKAEPHKVKYGAVQRDGFAAEYNIDPVDNFEDWNRNHKAVQGQLEAMLPKGYSLVATPAVRFSPEVFDAAPDEAKELGCQPDWNAWEQRINPPPKLPSDPYLRCAGGHIHFGWTEDEQPTDLQHMLNGFDLTKQLDWFLGAWSVKHDPDATRRLLYGNAGACRIKNYGVEYRVLSNFWVMDKTLRLEVWNRAVEAINFMSKKFLPDHAPSGYNNLVQTAIGKGFVDPQLARMYPWPIQTLTQKVY